jgi:hypothetical protein
MAGRINHRYEGGVWDDEEVDKTWSWSAASSSSLQPYRAAVGERSEQVVVLRPVAASSA